MKLRARLRALYAEYPRQFWLVVGTAFIDGTGRFMLFPFLAIYITNTFEVGLTAVGVVLLIFSLTAMVGGFFGGALTDRFGRKRIIVFSLVASATTNLLIGLSPSLTLLYIFATIGGLFANMGGAAHSAMISDLLPPEKRAEGFGILRVAVNLTVVIGPILGGLVATQSFLWLFIADFTGSTTAALILAAYLRESYTPVPHAADTPRAGLGGTLASYRVVMRDQVFLVFMGAVLFSNLAYIQMNSTLAYYVHDVRGLPPSAYSLLLSLNAALVVLFQFWISRRLRGQTPAYMMAASCLLYAIGFAVYGAVDIFALYVVAMAIITLGEMIMDPMMQSTVAALAPETARGRYMAFQRLMWELPMGTATLGAGLIIDNTAPEILWAAASTCAVIAAVIFVFLRPMMAAQQRVGVPLSAPLPGGD